MKHNKDDLRVEKTRDKLVKSFIDLVVSNLSNKVLDICDNANVTSMTFYHHFENKTDFINYLVKKQIESFLPIPKKLKPTNTKQLAFYVITTIFKFANDNNKLLTQGLLSKDKTYIDLLSKTIMFYVSQELSVLQFTWDNQQIISTTNMFVGGIIKEVNERLLHSQPINASLTWKTFRAFVDEININNN